MKNKEVAVKKEHKSFWGEHVMWKNKKLGEHKGSGNPL